MLVAPALHLVEQTHLFEHRERGTAKVDGLPAGTQFGGPAR